MSDKEDVKEALDPLKLTLEVLTEDGAFATLNAKLVKQLFDAHKANGFTDEQATLFVSSALKAGNQIK